MVWDRHVREGLTATSNDGRLRLSRSPAFPTCRDARSVRISSSYSVALRCHYNSEEALPAQSAAAEEHRCIPTMDVDMCQRKQLTVVLLPVLIARCHGPATSSQNHAAPTADSKPASLTPSASTA